MSKSYVRIGKFHIKDVLPYIFTKEVRKKLACLGVKYSDRKWKNAATKKFRVGKRGKIVRVKMGNHRYEMFKNKGTDCVCCGLKGKYFALEKLLKLKSNAPKDVYHFNLYGIDENGNEVMLTKDHIKPKAKGGKNALSNYQTMCKKCNSKKADKFP